MRARVQNLHGEKKDDGTQGWTHSVPQKSYSLRDMPSNTHLEGVSVSYQPIGCLRTGRSRIRLKLATFCGKKKAKLTDVGCPELRWSSSWGQITLRCRKCSAYRHTAEKRAEGSPTENLLLRFRCSFFFPRLLISSPQVWKGGSPLQPRITLAAHLRA